MILASDGHVLATNDQLDPTVGLDVYAPDVLDLLLEEEESDDYYFSCKPFGGAQ